MNYSFPGTAAGPRPAPWVSVLNRFISRSPASGPCAWLLEQLLDADSLTERMPRISRHYAEFFGPQDVAGSRYPLNRLGSFARIDLNYLPHWVDLAGLQARLRTTPHTSLRGTPTPPDIPTADLTEAIGVIGALTYSSEWVDDPETAADLDNSASAASVLQVNALMGREVPPDLSRTTSRTLHVLDIGVGRGNTLWPVLCMLAEMGNKHVRVSLMDISEAQLAKTAERISRDAHAQGLRVEFVELLECNLHELGVSVPARSDAFDLIVSGGTLFHSTEKQRIFNWAYASLRPQGTFLLWDWFAPCWAAPTLRIGQAEHHEARDTFVTTHEQASAAAQTWSIGWFGPRGYFNYGSPDYTDLILDLQGQLERFMAGEQFNFVDWLSAVATRYPPPDPIAHYYCIEGYTTPAIYRDHIRKSGFRTRASFSQAALRARHGVPGDALTGDGYDNTVRIFVLERVGAK